VFCLLTLPFRLLFGILFLPFLLLRFFLKLVAAIVLLPLFLFVGFILLLVGGVALLFAVLAPLIPLALLVFGIVAAVKLAGHLGATV